MVPVVAEASAPRIFIQEYQIKGARQLTRNEIEEAVYPSLGPSRTQEDVEKARAALEQAYLAKGYQTVSVQIPAQPWQDGPIILEVKEAPVGRLRVRGARYYLPSRIQEMAPSLAAGQVMNFNEVNRDIVALNQLPGRRVIPSLHPGMTPGTVDIDLDVKDAFPLHGSLEVNNRYSANTSELRLAGSLSYDNLWQWGHSVGASFQLSPENINQVQVYSGYYLARFPEMSWLSLMLQGTKQDSAVAVGPLDVAGRGETVGFRTMIVLPAGKAFSQTLNFGFDYKHNEQDAGQPGPPYYYFPFSVGYSATWVVNTNRTEFNIGPTFSFRGTGHNLEEARVGADDSFIYLRGDLSHTHELPDGFQLFGKIQGQVASMPLVSGEQFGGGGLGTARGYLEGEVFGDDAVFGTVELRSPPLDKLVGNKASDWRCYLFVEGGRLSVLQPLPQQVSEFDLASVGVGSRIRFLDHFNGSLDLGVPLISQSPTSAYDPRLTFRLWATY